MRLDFIKSSRMTWWLFVPLMSNENYFSSHIAIKHVCSHAAEMISQHLKSEKKNKTLYDSQEYLPNETVLVVLKYQTA